MVKLAIEMGMPAVTAQMDIRLRKPVRVQEKITVTAVMLEDTRKLIEASAKAVTEGNEVVADAKGKLVKVDLKRRE